MLFRVYRSLELDRGRRLTGAIVEHAVDVLDLIDDAAVDSLARPRGMLWPSAVMKSVVTAQGRGVSHGALIITRSTLCILAERRNTG